ncbi:MAG: hypothetical protein ACI81P_003637, partial [Neolewinella sp.]
CNKRFKGEWAVPGGGVMSPLTTALKTAFFSRGTAHSPLLVW